MNLERLATADGPSQYRTLSALAEPNRLRIVDLLRAGPLTVGEVASRLDLRQPQASKHLKVLTDAGILEVKAEANRRIHGLRPEPFESLETWLERIERATAERFERLDGYLGTLVRSHHDPHGTGTRRLADPVTPKEENDD